MIQRLVPAFIAFLGAMVWALSHASDVVRYLTWAVVAVVDIAGFAVVWLAARVEGHRHPARAARMFSFAWLAVLGWGATVIALIAWLGELGGAALNRDPGTAGLTVAAVLTLAAAVVGVVGDVAAAWTPAGVAESAVRRVYAPRFPRLSADGPDPATYRDAYHAVWDDPAILVSTEVVVGWDLAARRRRLELVADALA